MKTLHKILNVVFTIFGFALMIGMAVFVIYAVEHAETPEEKQAVTTLLLLMG